VRNKSHTIAVHENFKAYVLELRFIRIGWSWITTRFRRFRIIFLESILLVPISSEACLFIICLSVTFSEALSIE